jgi:hypothetical protein
MPIVISDFLCLTLGVPEARFLRVRLAESYHSLDEPTPESSVQVSRKPNPLPPHLQPEPGLVRDTLQSDNAGAFWGLPLVLPPRLVLLIAEIKARDLSRAGRFDQPVVIFL